MHKFTKPRSKPRKTLIVNQYQQNFNSLIQNYKKGANKQFTFVNLQW